MPFWRRKTVQERLAKKDDRVRMKQQKAQIKEVKRKIWIGGLRPFMTERWEQMERTIKELEKSPVSINDAKKILMKNGLARDEITASLQVEALLKKKYLAMTVDEGIKLVPVHGVGGEVKYTIKRVRLPGNEPP